MNVLAAAASAASSTPFVAEVAQLDVFNSLSGSECRNLEMLRSPTVSRHHFGTLLLQTSCYRS